MHACLSFHHMKIPTSNKPCIWSLIFLSNVINNIHNNSKSKTCINDDNNNNSTNNTVDNIYNDNDKIMKNNDRQYLLDLIILSLFCFGYCNVYLMNIYIY